MAILEKCYSSKGFEFVSIIGGNGSGKTSLLRRFCKGKKAIMFSAVKSDVANNLGALSRAVSRSLYKEVRNLVTFKSMDSALEFIYKLSEKGRLVFIIDNYDDLSRSMDGLSELFRMYLSHIFHKYNIMFVITGSRAFMNGQRFGIEPIRLELGNLTFSEVRDSFRNYSHQDLVALYGFTGGSPSILRYVDPDMSIRDNIEAICLSPDGIMFDLPLRRLMETVRSPETYCALLSSMSGGPTPMKVIVSNTSIGSSAACSTYLSNLIESGIVEKEMPFRENGSRRGMYRIMDIPTAFWIRFIQGSQSLIEYRGDEDLFDSMVEGGLEQYLQHVFRDICSSFIVRNPSLFDIDPHQIGRWWGQGDHSTEFIDIVVESNDRMTTMFCDCRYRDSLVGEGVLRELKRKAERINVLGRRTYALFSKNGFTAELTRLSDAEDVFLFDLSDICWF